MPVALDPQRFFSDRYDAYARFIRLMRYPQGLHAFFRKSALLRPGLRILDAGCGTGALTLAVYDAALRRGFAPACIDAFDLTPAMLDRFRETLQRRNIDGIELTQANVLSLETLPRSWTAYDLIVSASMLEYVPREQFVDALRGLRALLKPEGVFVLFMTRRNPLTRLLIGRWWRSNLYSAADLADAFHRAGFSRCNFRRFPAAAVHLRLWGHIVEARY